MTAWTVLYDRPKCPIIYYQPIDAVSYNGSLPAVRAYGQGGNAIVPWERFMAMQDMTVLYGNWSNDLYQKALQAPEMQLLSKYADTRVIRHGVDTKHFSPIDTNSYVSNRKSSRSIMGVPQDAFIVLSVMANQPRKDWPGVLSVIKRLNDRGIPARLMPWTNVLPHVGSLDIEWAAETMGLKNLVFPPAMTTVNTPDNMMPAVYGCADVHLLLSFGEGVGLPHLEATACGVPALAVNATGTVDYFAAEEQKIPSNPVSQWQMAQGNALIRPTVDYDVVAEKIAGIYEDPEKSFEWANEARKVAQGWSWEATAADWQECINYTFENKERIMRKKEDVANVITQGMNKE
jgi:glycosyltransferase involved in cell wall biosynthesis